jgi:hypothetical protein
VRELLKVGWLLMVDRGRIVQGRETASSMAPFVAFSFRPTGRNGPNFRHLCDLPMVVNKEKGREETWNEGASCR